MKQPVTVFQDLRIFAEDLPFVTRSSEHHYASEGGGGGGGGVGGGVLFKDGAS